MVGASARTDSGEHIFARANAAFLRRFVLIATSIMTLYSYWLATGRTWVATHTDENFFGADFFRNQADAILHGRLDVPFRNYSWNECLMINGKCYGYFGVFPSILRIPEFFVTGTRAVNHIPIYVALAVGVCFWASLDLFVRLIRKAIDNDSMSAAFANRLLALGVLICGPASALVFLSEPAVYEEAIIWAVAMSMVCVNMVVRWVDDGQRVHLYVAVAAATAAANSRVSGVPVAVLLGAYLLYRRHVRRQATPDAVASRWEIGLVAIPAVTYAMTMWAKFGSLSIPFSASSYYNDAVMVRIRELNDGVYFGFRFVFTNVAQYLRPDSLGLSTTYPWVRFAIKSSNEALILPPVVSAGTWAAYPVSITNTMFVPLVFTSSMVLASAKNIIRSRAIDVRSALLLTTATATAPTLMSYSSTARYLGDFYPFLIVGSVFGLAALLSSKSISETVKSTVINVCIAVAGANAFVWYVIQINRW